MSVLSIILLKQAEPCACADKWNAKGINSIAHVYTCDRFCKIFIVYTYIYHITKIHDGKLQLQLASNQDMNLTQHASDQWVPYETFKLARSPILYHPLYRGMCSTLAKLRDFRSLQDECSLEIEAPELRILPEIFGCHQPLEKVIR